MQMESNPKQISFRRQFDKINLFNFMSNDLVSYAAQKYGQEFTEFIDMKCGAIPEGDYEKIIDPDSPEQFLMLYTDVVLKRISVTCGKILELGEGYDRVLANYFSDAGKNLNLPSPSTIDDAYGLIKLCVLEKQNAAEDVIIRKETDCLIWKNADADISMWKLLIPFISGILGNSGFSFSITEGSDLVLNRN